MACNNRGHRSEPHLSVIFGWLWHLARLLLCIQKSSSHSVKMSGQPASNPYSRLGVHDELKQLTTEFLTTATHNDVCDVWPLRHRDSTHQPGSWGWSVEPFSVAVQSAGETRCKCMFSEMAAAAGGRKCTKNASIRGLM